MVLTMSRKVCILTSVHSPFDGRIFHKEAKTLARAGYDVTLIAQSKKTGIVDGIKIVGLPIPTNRFHRIFFLTWRVFILARKQKSDLYHFHDPELIPIGLMLKILSSAKIIYDVHEDVPEQILTKYWIPRFLRRPIAILFNFFEKILAHMFDATITATEAIGDKFRIHNKIVIHNFPDLQLFKHLHGLHKSVDNKTLVYAGGISRTRGAIEMIQALEYLKDLKNIQLLMIGWFDPQSLKTELEDLPGYRNVRFLGLLNLEKVYEYLAVSDIGLICAHPEARALVALPVKLFEYMAAGIPVIASNFPLWKKIVEENNCGLCIDPLKPREIANAVAYLISHPNEAKKMGQNGQRAAMEKYNWAAEEKNLLRFYQDLISQSR